MVPIKAEARRTILKEAEIVVNIQNVINSALDTDNISFLKQKEPGLCENSYQKYPG